MENHKPICYTSGKCHCYDDPFPDEEKKDYTQEELEEINKYAADFEKRLQDLRQKVFPGKNCPSSVREPLTKRSKQTQ